MTITESRLAEIAALEHAFGMTIAEQRELVRGYRDSRAALAFKEEEIARLTAERDALKRQAQQHAGEARAANATIAEIYQLCTGRSGEPGNWNGAEPVRRLIAERDAIVEKHVSSIWKQEG